MSAGSVYSVRRTACLRDCGEPDAKTCPRRRSGHTSWGFIVNLRRLPGGRWQQLRRQGLATRREAEDRLADEVPDIRAGRARSLEDRQLTIAAWAPVWLDSKVNLKPSSRAGYQAILDAYVVPPLGRVKLIELSPAHVEAWLTEVRSGRLRPPTNRRGEDGTLSDRTVLHIFAVLRALTRGAVKRHMIPHDPCFGAELVTPAEHEARVWGPSEAEQFLRFVEEHEPALAIGFRLALRFGLRRGEILALLWVDTGDDIRISRNAVGVGGAIEVGTPKSKAGNRHVPADADPGWADALSRHRDRQRFDRRAAGEAWEETGLVVTDPHGRMVAPWWFSERWRKLVAEAGLPPIKLHEARHSANSLWREAGIDSTVRAVWLGHGTLALTEKTYNHVRPQAHADAARKAAAFWKAASSGN